MTKFVNFLKDEDGAVTIEWVALAAGVVILALGVITVLDPALEGVASNIATNIDSTTTSLLNDSTTTN